MLVKLFTNLYKSNKLLYQARKCTVCAKPFETNNVQAYEEKNFQEKLLKVAIIGIPNAGKSTFINNLMDRKVCATSSKVHTTRNKTKAIFTEADSQIIFLDTPGLVNQKEIKRFNLGRSFSKDSKACLQDADVIGVLHDVSNIYTRDRLDMKVIMLLDANKKKPSILILNKIDMLRSKRKLLDMTRLLTESQINGKLIPNAKIPDGKGDKGWPHFQEIFMVSALTGSGLDDVRNYLVSKARPNKWLYPAEVWTDQSPEEVVVNTVKGKFLDFLKAELPYALQVQMELFDVDENGTIKTVVIAKCPTDRIAKLIAGEQDGRLKQITESAQKDLQHAFQNYVRISIVLQGSNNIK